MKIILHSHLEPDECRKRLEQETVPPPNWFVRWSGIGYGRRRRLEDAPVIGWIDDLSFELEVREVMSRHRSWTGRLDHDAARGGTIVTLEKTTPLWVAIVFLAVVGSMFATVLGKKELARPESVFWGAVFPLLFFGSALALIIVLNVRLDRRTARVLAEFLKRVLDAN